ncbi:hypothetical protein JCM1393_27960 [Clostridium carnis]
MYKNIYIEEEYYIYNGKKYEFSNQKEINRVLKGNINILILGEQLLIKKYNLESNIDNLEKYVDDIIKREFRIYSDMLFHYEYIKDLDILYLYSIKRGKEAEILGSKAKKLNVIPIQFLIKNKIKLKFDLTKVYTIISKYRDKYYLLEIRNGLIVNNIVSNLKEDIEIYLNNNKGERDFIIDKYLKDDFKYEEISKGNFKFLEIRKCISEKIS